MHERAIVVAECMERDPSTPGDHLMAPNSLQYFLRTRNRDAEGDLLLKAR
jgi:hypothetical protein